MPEEADPKGATAALDAEVRHAVAPSLGAAKPGLDVIAQEGFLLAVAVAAAGDGEHFGQAAHARGVELAHEPADGAFGAQPVQIDLQGGLT